MKRKPRGSPAVDVQRIHHEVYEVIPVYPTCVISCLMTGWLFGLQFIQRKSIGPS